MRERENERARGGEKKEKKEKRRREAGKTTVIEQKKIQSLYRLSELLSFLGQDECDPDVEKTNDTTLTLISSHVDLSWSAARSRAERTTRRASSDSESDEPTRNLFFYCLFFDVVFFRFFFIFR